MFNLQLPTKNGRSFPWAALHKLSLALICVLLSAVLWLVATASALPTGHMGQYERTVQYSGTPTFRITQVKVDESVTIETNNFPAGYTFTVTMGRMGTKGINGISVGSLNSGTGGTLSQTFAIPAELKGQTQIAIRAQTTHTNPFYAYNWFYNATANVTPTPTPSPTPTPTPTPPAPGYSGTPTFQVCSVAKDQSVTITTHNFPANQDFMVTMGAMGTKGIGGTAVVTYNSGAGGTANVTFTIPANLAGLSRIAIRLQTSHAHPYYAYNWFWNNTASVCN